MKTAIFALIALALAIPTWGVSLIVFLWLKSKYDNKALNLIMAEAVMSYNDGNFRHLHNINNASIRKIYEVFGTQYYGYSVDEYIRSNEAGILRTDFHYEKNVIYPIIQHPILGEILLYLSQGERNKLNIFAMKIPK